MCFDKRGIPIERGDIVKVFHFVGARRKRHYMYKQCLGLGRYPTSPPGWQKVFFSHLNFLEIGDRNGPYHEEPGETLPDYKIVQSIKCDHETRPKSKERVEPMSDERHPATTSDDLVERDEAFCEAYYAAHLTHALDALRDGFPYQINADGAFALIQQAATDRRAVKEAAARLSALERALTLAANRLDRLGLEVPDATALRFDVQEWVLEARQALVTQADGDQP